MADLFDIANLITAVGVDAVKIKSEPGLPEKSSNEILTELFSTFDADDGIVTPVNNIDNNEEVKVKVERPEKSQSKKKKKKHKHKDKKHKKKSKHAENSSETNSEIEGTKKKKKHKKKSKRKHEDHSNKSSDAERSAKKRKLDKNGLQSDESDIQGKADTNVKVEKAKNEAKSVGFEEKLGQFDSPLLPSISQKKEDENNVENIVVPKILEKPKPFIQGKIQIKDLKNSVIYNETVKEVENKEREKAAKMEDGEISDSSENERTPTLSPSLSLEDLQKRSSSPNIQSGFPVKEDLRLILKEKEKRKLKKSSSRSRSKSRGDRKDHKSHKEHRHSNKDRNNKRSHSCHSHDASKKTGSPSHSSSHCNKNGSREWDKHRERSRERRDRGRSSDKRESDRSRDRRKYDKDRHRSRSDDRNKDRYGKGRSRSRERKERIEIDKKKLLEIARKNAINMIKQGTLPLAQQNKAIAAIQAGGKTVEELTDFCKSLSKSEALGELSSISSDDDSSGSEKGFHHPFLLKERPSSIIMNIRDAKQLPTKTFQEKTAESSSQLRLQFPVSSGQLHRKTENEWVPVQPKKPEPTKKFVQASEPLSSTVPISIPHPPTTQVFTQNPPSQDVDIGSIVSQRLAAMRKLRENPNDVQALNEMYQAQNGMKTWAESKQMPGQFVGTTGAKVLTPAELTAGYQAWARKDQLLTAQPVSGGMGMALLQKMGWRPGEGLGKNKEGTLEPLQLEVKLDKKGLVSDQDISAKSGKAVKPVVPTIKTLTGKHPVSLLGEYCSKRKFGAPIYELCFECGPDHKKNFLFKVKVNGIEYKPTVASPNKKQAKAEAAQICLQTLGLLPS